MRVPHQCPTCGGRGIVRVDFYDLTPDYLRPISLDSVRAVKCRSCSGTGVVWDPDADSDSIELDDTFDYDFDKLAQHLGVPESLLNTVNSSKLKKAMDKYLQTGNDLVGLSNMIDESRNCRSAYTLSAGPVTRTSCTVVPEDPFVPNTRPMDGYDETIHMDRFDSESNPVFTSSTSYTPLSSARTGRITT